jgi:hypothetical protein
MKKRMQTFTAYPAENGRYAFFKGDGVECSKVVLIYDNGNMTVVDGKLINGVKSNLFRWRREALPEYSLEEEGFILKALQS